MQPLLPLLFFLFVFAASWLSPGIPSVSHYTTSFLSVVTRFLFVSFYSGTPDECLTPVVSHPLTELQFIDSGLGSQVGKSIVFLLQS